MTRPISDMAAMPHRAPNQPVQPLADSSGRVFTRNTREPAAGARDVDGVEPRLNYVVFRNGRLVPEKPVPVAQAPRIAPRTQPDSKELKMLRTKSRNLIEKMDRSVLAHSGRSVPFRTDRGERATLSQAADGAVTIFINGRQELTAFRDEHDRNDIHVLVKGPDGRLHAGRHLPPDYALKATRLVNSALFNARP